MSNYTWKAFGEEFEARDYEGNTDIGVVDGEYLVHTFQDRRAAALEILRLVDKVEELEAGHCILENQVRELIESGEANKPKALYHRQAKRLTAERDKALARVRDLEAKVVDLTDENRGVVREFRKVTAENRKLLRVAQALMNPRRRSDG